MPYLHCSTAPHFSGDSKQLVDFLDSVERLAQPLGLSDKDIIKYALRYSGREEKELFWMYKGDNYEHFANEALSWYPAHGIFYHYTHPKSAKLAPIEAPLEAPPAHTPPPLECAEAQLAAPAIAPIREKCDTILVPVVLEAPLDEITLPPVYIEAPTGRAPSQPISAPENPLAEVISPQLKICEPIVIAIAPEAPLKEIASPLVRDDLKHLSHLSAPHQEPSAVSEVQYATHFDQSLSLVNPFVADNFASIVFFAYSDYRLPVKHPCINSPNDQVEHVSGDPEATQAHHIAPENAQGTPLEALALKEPYSTSFPCSRAMFAHLALRVPIITEGLSHYRVFTLPSVLNRISLIQLELYFIQPSRRNLGAHLTYTHSPIASNFALSFAFFALIRVFRAFCMFTYHVDFTLAWPNNHSPMSWCLLRLDTVSIQSIRATFAPNFALYTSLTNVFIGKQPILVRPEDIINFAPKRANAPASRAPYHAVEPLYTPRIASPWRALALHRQVQEFILPVTSPPSSHRI
ncbi:hypothetical protein EV702DRAFT_1202734 [Suillus placidus]|uniref:Uncharacterized protein n=1 Tax=Suillus placidus TaxID=48579 RepID=A0A9P6ZK59_9AGAM|nr:hypothetical protein EV702DRAFT_1202734 [Suillus placidus]